jgi:ankyrin repeat protein
MPDMSEFPLYKDLFRALLKGQDDDFFRAVDAADAATLAAARTINGHTWIHECLGWKRVEMMKYLVRAGADVNAYHPPHTTPLQYAIHQDRLPERTDVVRWLLAHGADPNLGRPLISAMAPSCGDDATSLELVQLLVEAGADVNRTYDIYGDPDSTFTALEFAEGSGRHAVAAYLLSKGAVRRPPRPPAPPTKRKGR